MTEVIFENKAFTFGVFNNTLVSYRHTENKIFSATIFVPPI